MTTILRVKRRAVGGSAGAPSSLASGEIAYNMQDGYFYVGYGDDGGGNATSVKAFAKDDFNVSRLIPAGGTTNQVLAKSSSSNYALTWADPATGGASYTAGSGLSLDGTEFEVDFTLVAPKASPTFTGTVTVPTPSAADNSTKAASTAFVQGEIAAKAPLASPTFTGTPLAPTAATSTNNTQIATTAYVKAVMNELLNGAGAAYDTLKELQDLIVADESALSALTTTVSGKLTASSNLSDVANAGTARTNLGLGSMATQAASAVAITGGTIDGVTLDGGTF